MDQKRCPRCRLVKIASEFTKNKAQSGGLQVYCKLCFSEYNKGRQPKIKATLGRRYAANRERILDANKERYDLNPEPERARSRKANMTPEQYAKRTEIISRHRRKTKRAIFLRYGTTCACCGESNPGFLTIDHINGCGNEDRKKHGSGNAFYRWLKNNGFPEGFQTLCFNCNLGRSHYGGICPHKLTIDTWDQSKPEGDFRTNRPQRRIVKSE